MILFYDLHLKKYLILWQLFYIMSNKQLIYFSWQLSNEFMMIYIKIFLYEIM